MIPPLATRRRSIRFETLERRRLLAGDVAFVPTVQVFDATDHTVALQVERSGDDSAAATVDYATSDGTATAGTDYVATQATATFQAGEATADVDIPLLDPGVVAAPTRSFNVVLSNPTGGLTLGTPATFATTIEETTATTTTKLKLSSGTDNPSTATGISLDNTENFGQALTFEAVVGRPNPGPGFSTGTVSFSIDGGPSQVVAVTPNPVFFVGNFPPATYGQSVAAYFTPPTLSIGTHTIVATYGGDATSGVSTDTITETINPAASNISLVEPANPAPLGQPDTFTADVVATNPAAGTPTGIVTLTIETGSAINGESVEETLTATLVPSATVAGRATATFTTSDLTRGAHDVTALYNGDAHFATATDSNVAAVGDPTTTTLVGPADGASAAGEPADFIATVATTGPASGLTGSVTFTIDNVVQTPVPITASTTDPSQAVAVFVTAPLAAGPHLITAVYSGAFPYTAQSTSPTVLLTTAAGPTTPTPTTPTPTTPTPTTPTPTTPTPTPTSPTPPMASTAALTTVGTGAVGQPFAIIAAVTGATTGGGTPTGQIALFDGIALIGTLTLDAKGQAAFYIPSLPAGAHHYSVVYAGDSGYQATLAALGTIGVSTSNPIVSGIARAGAANQATAAVVLTFTAALDPTAARVAASYRITTASGQRIGVRSATYNAAADAVTLHLAGRLLPRASYHLRVAGAVVGEQPTRGRSPPRRRR